MQASLLLYRLLLSAVVFEQDVHLADRLHPVLQLPPLLGVRGAPAAGGARRAPHAVRHSAAAHTPNHSAPVRSCSATAFKVVIAWLDTNGSSEDEVTGEVAKEQTRRDCASDLAVPQSHALGALFL